MNITGGKRYVYLNYAQQQLYYAASRRMVAVFARRTGKTHGMLTPYFHRVQKSMPRGHGSFVGLSRKQIMAKTLPAVCMALKSIFGLKEGQHFIIGKPNFKKLNYPEPIYKPNDWSNTMTFCNGFYWSLTSLMQAAALNGETVSSIVGDEGKFWPADKLNELFQANSGVIDPFGNECHSMYNPFYRSMGIFSDASLSSTACWMEREESKMDAVIESGPNKGRTSRELQTELIEHANKIIDYNDAVFYAKKAGRNVIVVSPERLSYAHELRQMCAERKGKFHILPNGENSKKNCDMLVEYKVLSAEDAELLYCNDYLITEDLYMYKLLCQNSKKYQQHINQMRCDCFNYFTGSTIDNVALLSESYIKEMLSTLSPMVAAISILGIKLKRTTGGFYFNLDIEKKHGYLDLEEENQVIDDNIVLKQVSNTYNGKTYTAEMETLDFERIAQIDDCRLDGDLHPDDELYIAGDWNSFINWLVIGVLRKDLNNRNRETLYIINSMHVLNPEMLEDLMEKFNRYYAPHRRQKRDITFFYDSTATYGKNYASRDQKDNKDIVIMYLEKAGWKVKPIYMGKQAFHRAKYKDINNALADITFPSIKINKQKNEALIVALENAGIKLGYNGFEKDKSGEKLTYNPDLESSMSVINGKLSITGKTNIPEIYRTDSTDAFDSLFWGIKYFRFRASSVFGVS